MQLELITDVRMLRDLRSEWNALLGSSRADSVFLTWEWIWTWWTVYGDQSRLHLLTARDDAGRLIGLAPLKRSRRSVAGIYGYDSLEFIGQGSDVTPEYLDFIADPQHEHQVRAAFADRLFDDPSWSSMDLRPINAASLGLDLQSRRVSRPDTVERLPDSICPILKLPGSTDEFLAKRSRNYRKKMGEYERRCERDGIRLRRCATPSEVAQAMTSLIELHCRRWDGQSRAFRSQQYCRFHLEVARALMERGHTRMFVLEAGSQPVALLYCFAYGGRYYFYQSGWDPDFARYRPGLVLMHKVIKEAINEKSVVFDFLRGDEAYKYRWATEHVTNVRLVCWRSVGVRTGASVQNLLTRLLHHARHQS